MQVYEYASVRMCKCANMQVYEYASVRICKCTNMQVCKYASVRMCKQARFYTGVSIGKTSE